MVKMSTKSDIENEYINTMMHDGCMCKNPDQEKLNALIQEYEKLGGTEGELIWNVIQKQAQKNNVKISSGTLGYPTF